MLLYDRFNEFASKGPSILGAKVLAQVLLSPPPCLT